MRAGQLAEVFSGVGVKTLSGTEVDPSVSRGHEFQGIQQFQRFLGAPCDKEEVPATFSWLTDEDAPVQQAAWLTWYDARRNQPRRSTEPRLLYPSLVEPIVYRASAGDTLFLCLSRSERHVTVLLCPAGSVVERQLLWLFGLEVAGKEVVAKEIDPGVELGFAARYVLEQIGIEVAPPDDDWLDRLLAAFGERFPGTAAFSAFARLNAGGVDARVAPDDALMTWLDFEERLFRTLERHIVGLRVAQGFMADGEADVDAFVAFSLSVQNRRKSRAGSSLEHHVAAVLKAGGLTFEQGATTEGKAKPDFLFPGRGAYHDPAFPTAALTMLGSKSTCKDRWRQVLAEAKRIPAKHLLTLEPAISTAQTDEMQTHALQLVVPGPLHQTYRQVQRDWLWTLEQFIGDVRARERSSASLRT